MRIISKFKDFYDGLTTPSDFRIWNRVRRNTVIDINDVFFKNNCPVGFEPWMDCSSIPCKQLAFVEYGLIIFCGKLHPYWKKDNVYSFSYDEYISEYKKTVPSGRWRNIWQNDAVRKLFAREFSIEYQHLNIRYKEPVLHLYWQLPPQYDAVNTSVNGKRLILEINPSLYDLQFYKVFDAALVFQDLERYIFNVLAENHDPPESISNKDKIRTHGFDDKYSFRKASQKKVKR